MKMKRMMMLTLVLLSTTALVLSAQSNAGRPQIGPYAGALLPTGDQKDVMKDAFLAGAQVAFAVSPAFHILGTFGWAPAENKFGLADNTTNVFTYDLGLELGLVRPMGSSWEWRPFIGAGGGARTLDYKDAALSSHTGGAGYGAIGTEFLESNTVIRLEGRYNVFNYHSPLVAEASSQTREDVGVALGISFHWK
jgi:hypothetical protein